MNNAGRDISVVVVTKNEERRIVRCLKALSDFDDVWVVDSLSEDRTAAIAREMGAQVVEFAWDGAYPKKRQWCLEHLDGLRDWVLWIDADEVMTVEAVEEILGCDRSEGVGGYYLAARYVYQGRVLRFGLRNNKIALFHRGRMGFPVVDDLSIEGMGEIEGHYQPVVMGQGVVRQLREPILHEAYDENWKERHRRYAVWQAAVEERDLLPRDERLMKRIFLRLPFRGAAAFLHSYIFKLGFLDGWGGFLFAKSRWDYYRMIANARKI